MKKIKILMVLGDLNLCNGISSYAMNYYKYLDSDKIHIDFVLTKGDVDKEYEDLIKSKGGNIFIIKNEKAIDIFINMKKIKFILKNNNYNIIHCHVINISYFYFKYAKKYGVNTRIIHSHTVLPKERNMLKKIRNKIFIKLVNNVSNQRYACSKEAGISLFNKKEFLVVNNAIEIEKYIFNNKIRMQKRKEYNIEDKLVIGHIGRFSEQKNHNFIVKLFKEIHDENKNTILLLIGDGPLREKIIDKVYEYGLEKSVIFVGQVKNVYDYLQIMDVFILPSLFEGLGIAAIEAQANGLVTLLSDKVPSKAKIIDSTEFLRLNSMEEWKKKILLQKISNFRENKIQDLINAGYDIKTETIKMEKLYNDYCNM